MPQGDKQKPAEIRAALKAVRAYEQDHAHSDDLAFIKARLPMIALHMGECDPDKLLSHINKGRAHIEALLEQHCQKKKPDQKTYESVIKSLKPIRRRFEQALKEGNIDLIKSLIKQGATPDKYHNVLEFVVSSGNLEAVRYVIEDLKLNVDKYKADSGWYSNIVGDAVEHGYTDIMLYLRREGFHGTDMRCLTRALDHGHLNLARYFVKTVVDADFKEATMGALHRAIRDGRFDVACYLMDRRERLSKGSWPDNSNFWPDMIKLAAKKGHVRFLKKLVEGTDYLWLSDIEFGTALIYAARNGHYEFAEYLLELDLASGLHKKEHFEDRYYKKAMWVAAERGDLKYLKRCVTKCNHDEAAINNAFGSAVHAGDLKAARYLLKKGAKVKAFAVDTIEKIAKTGALNLIKFLCDNGLDVDEFDTHLAKAASNGHLELVEYLLLKEGAELTYYLDAAIGDNQLDMTKYLLERDIDRGERSVFLKEKNEYLSWAITSRNFEMADYLIEKGADLNEIDQDKHAEYKRYALWLKVHGEQGVKVFDPYLFDDEPYFVKPKTHAAVLKMMEAEGYKSDIAHGYAYNIAAFFGNEERVLRYLEKWGEDGKQPLHDITHMIKLSRIDMSSVDIKAWADASLQHGPKMAKLFRFAEELSCPAKDEAGKGWSYIKTRDEVSQFDYNNGHKDAELAALCFEHEWNNDGFDDALEHILEYQKRYAANDNRKKENLIPDIKIDGSAFGKEDYHFYKLADGDLRGLFLGELTNCCQHLQSEGADCAEHGFLSESGGFYVIADKKNDRIIAQSWAWRGKKGELCFDSLESLKGHFNKKSWQKLMDVFADELSNNNEAGISAVHIGDGGATPKLPFDKAQKQAELADYNGYRDSKSQYLVRTL